MRLWFLSFITCFLAFDIWWWVRADRALRGIRRSRIWRTLLAIFTLGMISFPILMLLTPAINRQHAVLPKVWPMAVFIWHVLILPASLVVYLLVSGGWGIFRLAKRIFRRGQRPPEPALADSSRATLALSRRRFLAAAAVALPPAVAGAAVAASMGQLGEFRVNRTDLAIAGWPKDLDGYSLALVADIHAGIFTTDKMMADIREITNSLRPDVTLLLGDLINVSLADLPNALDMVKRLDARQGVYMIEGNHDLMQSPTEFIRQVHVAGIPLLREQGVTIRPAGHNPFQLLGLSWAGPQPAIDANVRTVAAQRDPELFPILLSHHPHAWESAADAGFPLVLSGHTHGGQIMLTKNIGGGPIRFRHWSGVYRSPGSTLLVSNGVGNWFPLRINAPAEIVHLILHPV